MLHAAPAAAPPPRTLPLLRLQMLGSSGIYRAFDLAGCDAMLPLAPSAHATIIGCLVPDWGAVADGLPCIVVTKRQGILFRRVHNHLAADASLGLRADNPAHPTQEVPAADVLEIWEAKAYIGDHFTQAAPSLDQLASIVLDLREQVSQLQPARAQ